MAGTDPFVPASPVPVDPDDALAELEADFEDLTTPPDVIVVPEDSPPIGRSWGFDFLGGGFRIGSSAAPVGTYDLSTLIQWCEKALRTSKGSPIHPPGYGMDDPDVLLGQVIDGAPVAALQAQIRSALLFHPRISNVQDFSFDYDPGDEWVAVGFSVVLDDSRVFQMSATLSPTVTTEF
jgi:Protein of unknown function (DUF2634)